ncbi:hypothetical protein RINTHH_7580 [Richelia intracellularis HH01]|uniref:Uncharacterized protein n=1 Tax=Richelia intracellularis HH01 TaxID=1165094 RepID=M1WZL4_9NOST|nr:hypothetical protein RINTHH_7580 [Richelia intracellularis HH01]
MKVLVLSTNYLVKARLNSKTYGIESAVFYNKHNLLIFL